MPVQKIDEGPKMASRRQSIGLRVLGQSRIYIKLARTGVDGFFMVFAVAEADDSRSEAIKLVESWRVNMSETDGCEK